MRPGCDRDASTRLTYDPIACEVWLDDLAARVGRSQEICTLHAERQTVPRGWVLSDRRSEQPPMFEAPVAPAPAAPAASRGAAPRRRRRRAEDADHPAVQTLELFEVLRQELAEAEAEIEAAVEEPAVEEPAGDPAPDEPEDDVPASLQATSPLLARAFASTGHQRSVLTQRSTSGAEGTEGEAERT